MLHPSLPSGCSRVSLPGLENLRRFMLFQVAAFLSGLVQIEQRVRKVAGGGRDVAWGPAPWGPGQYWPQARALTAPCRMFSKERSSILFATRHGYQKEAQSTDYSPALLLFSAAPCKGALILPSKTHSNISWNFCMRLFRSQCLLSKTCAWLSPRALICLACVE